MYTDPTRIHATDPGHLAGNPVFAYHDVFNADSAQVAQLKVRYEAGRVGDKEVKALLIEALEVFLSPIRARRAELLAENPRIVEEVLSAGRDRVRPIAADTLREVRAAMGLDYFKS